ncbi:MAG: ribosome-associated translation inhibitor RaiA [Clostridia bacterium]|nr:ribosome-associated translation inhibitor RaiA [Clostridia bacterium]MBQ4575338.1 ribosome-associated translation inhibitor RaiA [Clostridia bacterium]
MKTTIIARKMDVPKDLEELFKKKLGKYDKFFRDDAEAHVVMSKRKNMEIIELTIMSAGTIFRSEQENSTFNNAFDCAMDAIERQIRKNKTRLEKRLREGAFVRETGEIIEEIPEEPEMSIRVKNFNFKPMSAEEAILQMNLLGHEFFVYENDTTGEVNVVYKRHDGGYGMIAPEDKK